MTKNATAAELAKLKETLARRDADKAANPAREKAISGLLAGMEAGEQQARADRIEKARWTPCMMKLGHIYNRPNEPTRPLHEPTMETLTGSISALGLLQPPLVDKNGCLIAGGHRVEAVRRLAAKDPARWEKIPVLKTDYAAAEDPARALADEAAENTARKGYTQTEARHMIERLRRAGYVETGGRPRKGEKALRPALECVLGISESTARRLLETKPTKTAEEKKGSHMNTFLKNMAALRGTLAPLLAADLPAKAPAPHLRKAIEHARALADLLADAQKEAVYITPKKEG